MTIKANINIKLLKAAAIACSNEQTRFYLQGVYVQTLGASTRYVATGGHRMIVLRDICNDNPIISPDPIKGVIIPASTIAALKISKATDYAEIHIDGIRFTIHYQQTSTGGLLIEGSFPDYERVIPRGPYAYKQASQFNAEYLASFQKAGNIIEKSDARIPLVSHTGTDNPTYIDFLPPGRIQGFGVLMPVRVPDGRRLATSAPEWLDGDHKPEKKAKAASDRVLA